MDPARFRTIVLALLLVMLHPPSALSQQAEGELEATVLESGGEFDEVGESEALVEDPSTPHPQARTLLPVGVRVQQTNASREVVTLPLPQTALDSSLALRLWQLPLEYRVTTEEGSTETDLVTHRDKPLRYDHERRQYRGTLYLGLRDRATPHASRPLSAPVPLLLISDAVDIRPSTPVIDHTSFPLEAVEVTTSFAVDSVSLKIVPDYDLEGETVWLPVQPHLRVDNPPSRVAGLGIGEETFTIRVAGMYVRRPITIVTEVSRGYVEPGRAVVGTDGSVTVHLRSEGIGAETLTASTMHMQPVSFTISYKWPIWFIVAAVLGGLAGSFLVMRWTDKAGPGLAAEGVLYGLFGAVAYVALGINLLGIPIPQPFAEASIFAFCTLLVLTRHIPDFLLDATTSE